MNEDADAFAERDAYGLTSDDWMSFLGFYPEDYSGPALLWWALAGISEHEGPRVMNEHPFLRLLTSLAGDAGALAGLASSSFNDDVRALAPALKNRHRRLDAAVAIAGRVEEEEGAEIGGSSTRTERRPPPALPAPKELTRRRAR